jgi:hypothetical protein
MYLSIGFLSDYSGVIPENSGATISSMGTIYTGVTEWSVSDTNGVHNYNFSLTLNNYVLVSNSIINFRSSYVWYRKEVCPQYYYLISHDCVACDVTCDTCSGTTATSCLTCPSTRSYNLGNKTCTCLTGYIDQGGRDCIEVTCNNDLCRTCANIN